MQLPNGDQPRGFVLRTHRSGEPVDPGGKEDQRRPCRTLDGSYQCLRVHSPQAGQRSTDKTSCTRDDPQHHSGLLQQVQIESFIRNGNICQATATKKIITSCTISVPLFALAMNVIVKSAEVECRGPMSRSGTRQPTIRAFMDDLTVTAASVPGCRWLLQGLQRLILWARMSFKPAKSRSLVLKKGKVANHFRFTLET